MQQEEQTSLNGPMKEESVVLPKPRPRAPMPPWSLVIDRLPNRRGVFQIIDETVREWFQSIHEPWDVKRKEEDGTVRYRVVEQERIVFDLFIRPTEGDGCILAVDDVPEEHLKEYNYLIAYFPKYLEEEFALSITIDAQPVPEPPAPEPPPYDEEAANAEIAALLVQMITSVVRSNAHELRNSDDLPKKPGKGASRHEWYEYKFRTDQLGIHEISHQEIADEIGITEGTVRNDYSKWKKTRMEKSRM